MPFRGHDILFIIFPIISAIPLSATASIILYKTWMHFLCLETKLFIRETRKGKISCSFSCLHL